MKIKTSLSRSVRVFVALTLLTTISACANLESVRDFSKQSASLTSGPQAIDYWANWNERSNRFDTLVAKLPPVDGTKAVGPTGPKSPPTKELVQEIKSLQTVLSAYMTKLGALAEDDLVDVSKQVDGLVDNLNNIQASNTDERAKTNAAYGAILKLVNKPLDAYRHRKVKQLITENDADIQAITKGLSVAMGSVSKFVATEKLSVLSWYDVTTGDYPAPSNFAEAYQWEKDRNAIIESYDSKVSAIASYEKALTTIGTLHSEMAQNLSTFNTQSFKILNSSLQDARREIIAARDQYKEAFK